MPNVTSLLVLSTFVISGESLLTPHQSYTRHSHGFHLKSFHLPSNIYAHKNENSIDSTPHDESKVISRRRERAMLALGSSVNLSREEASNVLSLCPELYCKVDNLLSKLLYFQSEMGIEKQTLKKMILQHPGLMSSTFLDDDLKSTVEVLQSELDFTSDEVWNLATNSFPQIMRYNRSDLRRKLNFYRVIIQMSDEELKRFVLAQPKVLQSTPQALVSACSMLEEELNMSIPDIKSILLKFPTFLVYSVEKNLRPTIRFLKESDIGVGLGLIQRASDPSSLHSSDKSVKQNLIKERVKAILLKYPNLVGFSVGNNLQPTIDFIRNEIGCSLDQLGKIIWRSPDMFGSSVEKNLRPKVNFIKEALGLGSGDMAVLAVRNPNVLTFSLEQNLIPKITYFSEELLFSKSELRQFLMERPQILDLSLEKNLLPKVNFFLGNDIGMNKEDLKLFILERPGQLSYNLETRIKPRIKILKDHGITFKEAPITIISRTDGSFQKWILENSNQSRGGAEMRI